MILIMNNRVKFIVYGIITFLFFSCNSSRYISGEYYCYFCPKGYITYSIELHKNGKGYIYTKVIRNPTVVDTIKWYEKDNCIHISGIDTMANPFENETIPSFPSKFIYSNNYILTMQDSSMVLYYKYRKTSIDKDEFYYWEMNVSGKEDSIIKAYFGDSLKIIKTLTQ